MYNENELASTIPSSNPVINVAAATGRKGDTMMAHVTPGDYVIPKDVLVQHPEFLVKLKKIMSDQHEDYRTHMVGSGFENINPNTGSPEFGFGKSFKSVTRSVGQAVGQTASKALPEAVASPLSSAVGKTAFLGGPGLAPYLTGYSEGVSTSKSSGGPGGGSSDSYSPGEMALPGSLQELGGLTDQQRRAYLASQGAYGEGLGGASRDYYINLLQRNIQQGQGSLLPAETQYLQSLNVNTNLGGNDLINALRGL